MINNLYIKATPTTAAVTWGSITGTLSDQTDLQSALDAKQDTLTLTTTGTSGAATLVGATLNIPQYGGGGGGLQGVHAILPLASGSVVSTNIGTGGFFTIGLTANRLYTIPFIPAQNITTSNLYINNSTATAGTFTRILIYSELNGFPDTKLYESTNLDMSTTGLKTATTTFNFIAGTLYWITLHASATNSINFHTPASLYCFGQQSGPGNPGITSYYNTTFTFGSAPATWPTGASTIKSASAFPFIGITKA